MRRSDDCYWSIDIPGLSEPDAKRIADWAMEHGLAPLGAWPVNPGVFLTPGLDAATVKVLVEALKRAGAEPAAAGMAEILRKWLDVCADAEMTRSSTRDWP